METIPLVVLVEKMLFTQSRIHELEREWYDETGIILNGLLDAYAQAAKRYGEV